MWRRNGDGEVYVYLPTSSEYGPSIGRSNWQFKPGNWYHLEQEAVLNTPGQRNGRIRVGLDGRQVLDEGKLTFRNADTLKIDGIFFSTFFGGGNDPSWATPAHGGLGRVHRPRGELKAGRCGRFFTLRPRSVLELV